MKKVILLLAGIAVLLFYSTGFSEVKVVNTSVKSGVSNSAKEDLTFMKLRIDLLSTKKPRRIKDDRFGVAEYYFKNKDFGDAFRDFKEFSASYPFDASTLLARVYLYKIAKLNNDEESAKLLKNEMFGNSFVLLFSKFKVLKYKSAFNNRYEIQYYLDKIKIFLNGEIFEEITP